MPFLFDIPFFIIFLLAELVTLAYLIIGIRLLILGDKEFSDAKIKSGKRNIIIVILFSVLIFIAYKAIMKWLREDINFIG